jgi:phosphoglycerate dehydrogenase-like enzyme
MEKIHILVTAPFIEDSHLERIAAVSPRVEVYNAKEAVVADLGEKLPPSFLAGSQTTRKVNGAEELDRVLAKTEIVFGLHLPKNLLARAPSLKWIQMIGAGIDRVAANPGLVESDVLVTNSHVNANVVAEYAVYLMMLLAKNASGLFANRQLHRWEILEVMELRGKTLGIVGLGEIGGRIAAKAQAFGMKVLATRRSVTQREKNIQGVDEIFPTHELHQMLKECDFLILAAPLSQETWGLIGEKELRLMKPTAGLINIARGQIIRQAVLVRALRERWIAAAALDVFDTEPLPPDSDLWGLPNVIISPHLARLTQDEIPGVIGLFCENLKRFLEGNRLINLVDRIRGY